MKIDFTIRKDTKYRKIEFKRRRKINIEEMQVFIVSIEDLIISKLLWAEDNHSELQIKDVRNLLKEKVDMKYICNWVKELNIANFFEEISDGYKQ